MIKIQKITKKTFKLIIILSITNILIFLLGVYLAPMWTDSIKHHEETPSAGDWINKNQIHVYDNKVVLDIEDAVLSGYTPTHSMRPTFDEDHNGIYIKITNDTELNIGDIISFETPNMSITHRIIDIKNDCYITKGDNYYLNDGCIKRENITKILVGVIY